MFEGLRQWFSKNWPSFFTTIWLCLIGGYILNTNGPFWSLSLNELGDFFAGAIGPLALLWLVRGYAQQNAALSVQSAELRTAVEQHKAQVDATRVLAENDARNARLDYYKLVSECSKEMGRCKLLLKGDTETKSATKAQYSEVPAFSNLNKSLDIIRKQQIQFAEKLSRHLLSAGLTPRKTQPARSPVEVLVGELERLSSQQEGFEKNLDEISTFSFAELEVAFRHVVKHSAAIQNLVARSEQYLEMKAKEEQLEAMLRKNIADGRHSEDKTSLEATPPAPTGNG